MAEQNGDGNGRKPFTMNLKLELMDDFRRFCEEHGYLPSRRIEVLMKRDITEDRNEEGGEREHGS